MTDTDKTTVCSPNFPIKIYKWKVREGFQVNNNQLILLYKLPNSDDKEIKRLKSTKCGVVKKRFFNEGDVVDAEKELLQLSDCIHATVIKDMCADCGADLRQDENTAQSEASVPMVHSVPELKVSHEQAQKLGKEDTIRLLKDRKLVLLVDLDQTIIHTTNDMVPTNIKGVYRYQLNDEPRAPIYHTRLRPGTFQFIENIAPYYELHICTFGARKYAHTIASYLDPSAKYFGNRILSRDECFSLTHKTDNLRALFPCGDSMVCIIDDREDVWNMATNLIQVKPYHFFQHTGDIHAPPGMSKHELDGKGVDFRELIEQSKNANKTQDESDNQPSTSTKDNPKNHENSTNVDTSTKISEDEQVKDESNSTDAKEADDDDDKIEQKKDEETTEHKNQNDENPTETTSTTANDTVTNVNDDVKSKSETADPKDKEHCTEIQIKPTTSDGSISGEDTLIDVEDPDDYLLYLETILIKIHSRFYAFYDETNQISDLKILLPKIRGEVLVGKTLVFSGLVPTQVKLEKSKVYQIARSLGANVTQQLTDDTTHLVASTAGTFKVNAARKMPNIHIVSPEWLWTCAERWECVEEKLFPLDSKKASKTRQPPAHCHSPEHFVNYSNLNDADVASSEQSTSSNISDSQPKFIDTINPLLSFSNDDLEAMNEDVNEIYESDSSDDESVDLENPPLDKNLRKRKREMEKEEIQRKLFHGESSIEIEYKGREEEEEEEEEDGGRTSQSNSSKDSSESCDESPADKFRRGDDLPSDLDIGSNNGSDVSSDHNDDEGDDGDWNMMGAALEREFLGLE